jgi:hypothetical protein
MSDKKESIKEPMEEELVLLRDEKLLLNIVREIRKQGVVGEEDKILVLINKICLRLVKNALPTSSNVMVSDNTGLGKDYIVGKVCKVLLDENIYKHWTSVSPKAFDHYKPETGIWDGMVVHLEDPDDETLNQSSFKTMASGGNSSITVKDQTAIERYFKGKPVFIVTSMKQSLGDELTRRWDCLRLDGSPALTKSVLSYIAKVSAGKIETEPDLFLWSALRKLQPATVIIPYAEQIGDLLPYNTTVMRTQFPKLLDYIKSSAVLHQYQREKDEQGNIIADICDLDYGMFCFQLLKDIEGQALNRAEEEFVNAIRKHGQNGIIIKDLLRVFHARGKNWIYENCENLQERGLLYSEEIWSQEANKMVICFYPHVFLSESYNQLTDEFSSKLGGCLVFQEMQESIDKDRAILCLPTIFSHTSNIQENHNNNDSITGEKGLSESDQKATRHNQTTKDELEGSSGQQKLKEEYERGV